MFSILCLSLALSLAINGLLFLIAFRLRSDKLTDASYAISFISLALYTFQQSSKTPYNAIAAGLVCLWALRIGSFLLYRVLRVGFDRRFDSMRDHFWKFGKFWLGQAVTVWVLMLPLLLVATEKLSWHTLTSVGVGVWLAGVILESIADLQKYRFTHTAANKGKWIDNGIWHYSRHPNYLGEILVWVGIYCYVFPGLSIPGKIVGSLSPVFITVLLLFVSGIPILERDADTRWGNDPAYQLYKKRTSLLLLWPKKKI